MFQVCWDHDAEEILLLPRYPEKLYKQRDVERVNSMSSALLVGLPFNICYALKLSVSACTVDSAHSQSQAEHLSHLFELLLMITGAG